MKMRFLTLLAFGAGIVSAMRLHHRPDHFHRPNRPSLTSRPVRPARPLAPSRPPVPSASVRPSVTSSASMTSRFSITSRSSSTVSTSSANPGTSRPSVPAVPPLSSLNFSTSSSSVSSRPSVSAVPAAPAPTTTPAPAAFWKPDASTTFQIQLFGNVSTSDVISGRTDTFILDLFDNTNTAIAAIKSQGIHVICYFSAGSYEDWRPDAGEWSAQADYGLPLEGWAGESWANTRSANVRRIMKDRLEMAKRKGCDGVDPDNTDVYDNGGGGMGLKKVDAVEYIAHLSDIAHGLGMGYGLKNSGGLIKEVIDKVDWVVNEQCQTFQECEGYSDVVKQNKPVFEIEYRDDPERDGGSFSEKEICDKGRALKFATVIKDMDLGSYGIVCSK